MGNSANRVKLTDYLLGQQSGVQGRNYVINPSGFENVNNITLTGSATVSQNTSSPLTALSDLQIALTNDTTDAVTWALNTLDNSLNGQNCMLSFDYTASSMGSAVQAQVLQGSNIAAYITLSAQSTPKNVVMNVPCGSLASATTVSIANVTGNSGSSALHVANMTYGKATNISQVSQAQSIGTLTYPATASSEWTTTSSSFANFSANSNAGTPTVTGSCTAPSTQIPGLTCTNLAPGTYWIVAEGGLSNSAAQWAAMRWFDGTNAAIGQQLTYGGTGGSEIFAGPIYGQFTYTSAQNSVTWQLQGAIGGGATLSIDNRPNIGAGIGSLSFVVYYYPSQSQLALTPNTAAQSWKGYFSTNAEWTNTTSSSVYGDFSGGSGNVLHQISNTNFGTVTQASGGLPGVTWTPTIAANYLVCVTGGSLTTNGGTANAGVALTDGSGNVLAQQSLLNISAGSGYSLSMCSIYTATSTAAQTVKIMGNTNSGTLVTNYFGDITNNSTLEFTIVNISQSLPAPILVGSVTTSNSIDSEVINRVFFGGPGSSTSPTACTSSPCTVYTQSGSWVTGVTRTSAGNYTMAIASGTFSDVPSCTVSTLSIGSIGYTTAGPNGSTLTKTSYVFTVKNLSSTQGDDAVQIICMGPK